MFGPLKKIAIATTLAASTLAGLSTGAAAAPISVPSHTTFGGILTANFGGTGIPNHAIAITTVVDGGNRLTLGMTAFQRYANPVVTNNGNGDFYATTGLNDGLDFPPQSLGATWGYGMYIDIAGGGVLGDYLFELLYDINPATANDETTHGRILLSTAFGLGGLSGASHFEDAQNLYASFFSTGFPPVVIAPGGVFNPFAVGEYTFSLRASRNQSSLGESNIRVNVNTVPEPATLALLATTMLLMLGLGWTRSRTA